MEYLDVVLPGIAHQLGRLIEAHGLAVENGRAEGFRMMAFEPSRDVDQEGEAGGMALWKAVLAETLDLAKAAFGKFLGVTAGRHAGAKEHREGSWKPRSRDFH